MLFFSACLMLSQTTKVSAPVKERVQDKLRRYKANHAKKCYERALTEAARLADSLMLEYARTKLDTAAIPPLPEKPQKPKVLPPKDSQALQPLFRE